ncbi:MAG: class I SAM-dependent methyltransferase [Saprospiraceae bacterium]|nr:class I SAM-dependent methyltransferase [Saprospiraceae bacterium]
MNENLTTYYHARAKEYDRVYQIPEEQQDLADATALFQALFSGKNILEIACGTGYWTDQISKTAASILATDINESVLEIARERIQAPNVVFQAADMFSLQLDGRFDGLFGGFIWSHVLLQDLDGLLQKTFHFLQPGSVVAFIDSKPVTGGSHDQRSITQTDEFGNTFQTRTLADGTQHLVLKNFPTEAFLRQKLLSFLTDLEYIELEHYWIVSGRLKA